MAEAYRDWLLVSDVDGTLNNRIRKLPRVNKIAISDFVAKGGHFTLASGRNVESILPHYRKIGVKAPVIFLNGAGIYDFSTDKMLDFSPISAEMEQIVGETAKRFPHTEVVVFTEDAAWFVHPRTDLFVRFWGMGLTQKKCASLSEVPHGHWGKVTFVGSRRTAQKILRVLKEPENARFGNTFLTSPMTLEIEGTGVSKGAALKKLATLLGVQMSHTAALGDYYNDEDMLRTAAHPVCCGQAPDELKKMSEHVACHCNQGAVADFIGYIENKYIKASGVSLEDRNGGFTYG